MSKLFNMEASETAAVRAYIRRIKQFREARGMTQAEMAAALGIPVERYKKYETRSMLPPYLIERFAAIVGHSIDQVVAGRSARPRP